MASIDKRSDGRYRARWREYPGGPQRTRQFRRKGDAERFLDTVRGDLARGVYIDPNGGRTLFQDYAETWRAGQLHRPSTAVQLETYLWVHAYPTLGRRQLRAIRRSDIQIWVKERSVVLAPGSVELVYRWVATIFKAAAADRLLRRRHASGSHCRRRTATRSCRCPSTPSSASSAPCPSATARSSSSGQEPACAKASASA